MAMRECLRLRSKCVYEIPVCRTNPQQTAAVGRTILHINSNEYDYHTLVKVAEMAGLAGLVGFHESEDGYIVSFPDTENTQALINDYKARLHDLENNIWQY